MLLVSTCAPQSWGLSSSNPYLKLHRDSEPGHSTTKEYSASSSVEVTVADLLDIAGADLDDVNVDDDSKTEWPYYRMSGRD